MKHKNALKGKILRLAIALIALPLIVWSGFTFAANSYNIEYSGGTELSASNVKTLTGNLTTLVESNNGQVQVSTSNSSKWKSGYIYNTAGDNTCIPFHYFFVNNSSNITASDGLSFRLTSGTNGKYDIEAQITSVTLDTTEPNSGREYVVGVAEQQGFLYSGWWQVFHDAECTNAVRKTDDSETLNGLTRSRPDKIFVQLKTKLHKHNETAVFKSNEQYFALTDIDAAQSYKILNSDNQLSANNMYTIDISRLQPTNTTLRNMFVSNNNGNYIYSQYTESEDIGLRGGNDIFVELNDNTQSNGLDIVFGFAEAAGSGLEYYSRQYTITYNSDDNGTITGRTSEVVFSGDNPSGSTQTPSDNYHFVCWKANKRVTLENGTTVAANTCIDDPTQIAVSEDITFTAYHAIDQFNVEYVSDEHGTIPDSALKQEIRDYGTNPTGSESEPKEEYEFIYWVADVDVTLEDGTVIKTGEKLSPEQVKQVVIDQDIEFTAIHKLIPTPAPNTGAPTSDYNAGQIVTSVFGITLGALFVVLPSRLHHKKVGVSKNR